MGLRVFNTWTDQNNGEWGAFDWTTTPNVLTIGSQDNGTGVARDISFVVGGLQSLLLGKPGYWSQIAGPLMFTNNPTIGNSSGGNLIVQHTLQPDQLYVAGSIQTAVRSAATATVTVDALADYFLCLDPAANAINVNLPPSPKLGLTYEIKDCTGHSATNNHHRRPQRQGTIR